MKILTYVIFLALLILHQDFWWWNNDSMVLGFLPVGLAFHVLFAIACAVLGFVAIKGIWPHELEKLSEQPLEELSTTGAEAAESDTTAPSEGADADE